MATHFVVMLSGEPMAAMVRKGRALEVAQEMAYRHPGQDVQVHRYRSSRLPTELLIRYWTEPDGDRLRLQYLEFELGL